MNRFTRGAAFAAAVVVSVAAPLAAAQAVTITNGSFEDGLLSNDLFTTLNATDSTSISGWTVANGSVDYIGNYWVASDGNRSIDLDGLTAGTLTQQLTGLTVDQYYRVSFDLAGNPASGPTTKTLDVTASAGSQSYGFTVLPSDTTSNMGWVTDSFVFKADSTSTLLSFISTTTSGGGNGHPAAYGPALDNVSISEVNSSVGTTPLPSSLALMLIGLAGLGAVFYGRRGRPSSPRVVAA